MYCQLNITFTLSFVMWHIHLKIGTKWTLNHWNQQPGNLVLWIGTVSMNSHGESCCSEWVSAVGDHWTPYIQQTSRRPLLVLTRPLGQRLGPGWRPNTPLGSTILHHNGLLFCSLFTPIQETLSKWDEESMKSSGPKNIFKMPILGEHYLVAQIAPPPGVVHYIF